MIGLSGCFWNGPLTAEVDALSRRLRLNITQSAYGTAHHHDGPVWRVSLTANRKEAAAVRPALSSDGDVELFLDGWIDRPAAMRTVPQTEYALQVFRGGGVDALRRHNGLFNAVVCERSRSAAHLVASRYSYLPLFHSISAGAFFFASEIRALLAAGICAPDIEDVECMTWLLFGRYLRDETKFRYVKLLPRGGAATWTEGALSIDNLAPFQYRTSDSRPQERLIGDLQETFRTAVARRANEEERIALGLSGGFDSRLILGAIDRRRRKDVFAFTWGDAGNDDMRIAARVAEAAGVEHRTYPVGHETYLARAEDGVWCSDGLSLFAHGFYPDVYDQVRQASGSAVVFNGIGLDVLLGGLFLDAEVLGGVRTRAELTAYYGRTLATFSREAFAALCRTDGEAWFDAALDRVAETVGELPGDRIPDINDQFHFETRTRRWIALAFPMVRPSVDTAAPCYDADFMDVLATVPPAYRFNRRLYAGLLASVAPDLSRVEYQKTLIPASVPPEHWAPFIALEQQREQAHYDLWRRSAGTVYVPYAHCPQNFVEWFRVHPAWQQFLHRTLLGAESVLIERYFEKRRLETLIQDHIQGRANRFKQLTLLVSLELFCRLFADGVAGLTQQETTQAERVR